MTEGQRQSGKRRPENGGIYPRAGVGAAPSGHTSSIPRRPEGEQDGVGGETRLAVSELLDACGSMEGPGWVTSKSLSFLTF